MKDIKIVKLPENLNVTLCLGNTYLHLCNAWIYDMDFIKLNSRIAEIIKRKKLYVAPAGQEVFADEIYDDKIQIYCGNENWRSLVKEMLLKDIADMTEIIDGLEFIIQKNIGTYESFKKYSIHAVDTDTDTEVTVNETSTLTIKNGKESIVFTLDEKEATPEEASDFFKNAYYENSRICNAISRMAFDQHSHHLGMQEIYMTMRQERFLRRERFYDRDVHNASEAIQVCYYCSTEPFFLLFEMYTKEGLPIENAFKLNPYFTGKPYPNPNDRIKTSKRSKEYIINLYGRRNNRVEDILETVARMEENPRISATGMDMLFTFMDQCKSLQEKSDNYWNCVFKHQINFDSLEEIFNTFDITMKTLIDRAIRAIFLNNTSPDDYINIIHDYIRMCKIIGIEIDKKLPKNVISQHDVLAMQIKDIQDAKIKEMFNNQIMENKKLIISLPGNPNYSIISPEETNDLIMEGKRMNHCVGSYINRVADGTSKIFFLRKKNDLKNSYVTIELNEYNNFVQAKAFSNALPSKEDMQYINEWVEMIGGYHE